MQDGGRLVTIDVKKICKYLGKMNHSILDIFRHTDYLPSVIYSFGSAIQHNKRQTIHYICKSSEVVLQHG
ncbi:hypothetical protein RC94_19930 [Pectobacterium brasiliense]|nr:hypothetical protein RC79_20020 [Pectobacterium brasiliense]KHT03958.1 hypothetical protein RC94_19930 [Pectobacterium brasiliense]